MGVNFVDLQGDFTPHAGGSSGVAFDVGVQVPSGDINAVLYVDASGNLATSADDGVIGATGVRLGYLLYAEHIADHVYLGHVDANTSSSVFQVDLRQSGDVVIKSPVASGSITYVAGISGTGTHSFLVNTSTARLTLNNTGVGFFGVTAVAKQTGPVLNITNSVTSGGTDGTIADFSDLTVFANSAAAIRNDIYQLARTAKFCSDALRAYGLLT